MPTITEMTNDLKEFLKTANDWDSFDLPLPYAEVVKVQKSKRKPAYLALKRNPNDKRRGVFYNSLAEFITDMNDIIETAESCGKILKVIEKINGNGKKITPTKTETKWDKI